MEWQEELGNCFGRTVEVEKRICRKTDVEAAPRAERQNRLREFGIPIVVANNARVTASQPIIEHLVVVASQEDTWGLVSERADEIEVGQVEVLKLINDEQTVRGE